MAQPSPFLILHNLRQSPLMAGSPKATLALAMLDASDPLPVSARTFREAFDCTPSEASHTLARLRENGLVVRDSKTSTYRLTFAADAERRRLAVIIAGGDLIPVPSAREEPA